ncbi:transposase [Halomonas lysinitropha]|uniref:Transposase n=1 Tax=Halomonas lysinitropha TaxID=2607506 RepID=A0A5K1I9J9_9GAMM|nr:transposase [Halomonas lysinitropha]VVZ96983.1 Transposase [Halomonas lysinitropha]
MDETASRRGHRYVTVFLDMQRKQESVIFAIPGHGKATIDTFSASLTAQGGDPDNVVEVVCDMSQAFLSGVVEHLPSAEVTTGWFYIVQTFTKALDEVHEIERRQQALIRINPSGHAPCAVRLSPRACHVPACNRPCTPPRPRQRAPGEPGVADGAAVLGHGD